MSETPGEANPCSSSSTLLDRIYELLEGIDQDLSLLEREPYNDSKINVYEVENILDAIRLLISFRYHNRLGLPATDVLKFDRIQGQITIDVLLRAGQRAKALLKELEGEVARQLSDNPIPEQSTPQSRWEKESQLPQVTVPARAWVRLRRGSNADLIAEISKLLDEAIRLAQSSNLPNEDRALSELERAQLIVLLETAINMLRAPLVEKGLLRKLKEAASAGAESAVRKKTEFALGYGLGKLAEKLMELLSGLD